MQRLVVVRNRKQYVDGALAPAGFTAGARHGPERVREPDFGMAGQTHGRDTPVGSAFSLPFPFFITHQMRSAITSSASPPLTANSISVE